MSTRVDYNKIIEYVEDSSEDTIEITQKKVKRLVNNELPKSFFSNRYIANGKNELARYILEKGFEFEVIEPKLIIKKRSA
ncbi:MAG TPA: hypothetical protein IAD08_02955 [Candidatus Scatovivens faecipullorum]|nr:hypothetical protein [Candidatus Scatovivens faecipullorum]